MKPDSPNQGGFTLFGKGFGNYEMDLVLRIVYDPHGEGREDGKGTGKRE